MLKGKAPGANPAPEQFNCNDSTTPGATDARFSIFRNSFDNDPAGNINLEALTAEIMGGKWQAQVERLRGMTSEQYSQHKRNLPAVAFGGLFSKRSKQALLTPSGLVVIDIDHVAPAELARMKGQLSADQHTALVFVSPSGAGLKAVFVADFVDDVTFKHAYRALSDYMARQYSITVDETGKDVCRLCYVSYDQAACLNLDATPFVYEVATSEANRGQVARPTTPVFIGNHQQRYVLSIINGEIENVETAPQGNGNPTLNIAAMKIGQLYYLGLFDKEAIRQHLTAAYLRRGGSFKNQHEADSTFESGWKAGIKSPRALPERGQP